MSNKHTGSDVGTDVKETHVSDTETQPSTVILKVKEETTISDGQHEGIITDVTHRTEPFGYIDVAIKEKESAATLKVGYPDTITKMTSLGRLLIEFDVALHAGMAIDLSKILLSKEVKFVTSNEETEKGVFARILRGTIKPLK